MDQFYFVLVNNKKQAALYRPGPDTFSITQWFQSSVFMPVNLVLFQYMENKLQLEVSVVKVQK